MNALISEFSLGNQGGLTAAIKDCIDIAGMPTRGGSAALADAPAATAHADVVQLLLGSGWHITAKANMHEIAYGMTGINATYGTAVNPQDPSRIPGGSSSGSASAVGAGLVDMAIGSDTGGSIRVPAACCGVIGFKPTFGRVSRKGAYPQHTTLDCIGPFTRTMDVMNQAMHAIAPGFDLARASVPMRTARIGIVTTNSDPIIIDALSRAFSVTGWEGEDLTLAGMDAAFDAGLTVINVETFAAFGHLIETGKLGADIAKRLDLAGKTTQVAKNTAEDIRTMFTDSVDAALEHYDALLLPTLPQLPPTLEDIQAGVSVITMSSLVRPFNLSGHPALSFPVPVANSPLKASLQLVGRKGQDEQLCALALHIEQMLHAQ